MAIPVGTSHQQCLTVLRTEQLSEQELYDFTCNLNIKSAQFTFFVTWPDSVTERSIDALREYQQAITTHQVNCSDRIRTGMAEMLSEIINR